VAKSHLIQQGRGGSVVLTSSTAGIKGYAGDSPGGIGYTAAKHGVVGLMRTYATVLGKYDVRCNAVAPTGANTPMVVNDVMKEWLSTDSTTSDLTNILPVHLIEARDVSNAIAWLVSDEARYVTGVLLPIDAGFTIK
jgi:NAD(P)-dependent dehydrogenase (short-subunit alcohol dehydrogenase family)